MDDKKLIRWTSGKAKYFYRGNGIHRCVGLSIVMCDEHKGVSINQGAPYINIRPFNTKNIAADSFVQIPVEAIPILAKTLNAWMLHNKVKNPDETITIEEKP